jgi:hypothetical protein
MSIQITGRVRPAFPTAAPAPLTAARAQTTLLGLLQAALLLTWADLFMEGSPDNLLFLVVELGLLSSVWCWHRRQPAWAWRLAWLTLGLGLGLPALLLGLRVVLFLLILLG